MFTPSLRNSRRVITDLRKEFPHTLLLDYDTARQIITESDPALQVVRVEKGAVTTSDVVFTRVRVYVDENDYVISVPKVG